MQVEKLVCFLLALTGAFAQFCPRPRNRFPYFGTITFYSDAETGQLPPIDQRAPRGCEPIYINMIVRHGARYPSRSETPIFDDLLHLATNLNVTGTATLCSRRLQAIRDWRLWTNRYNNQNQTARGDEEVEQVALRYREEFPELLQCGRHDHDRYRFISTDTPRTEQSMLRFAEEALCIDGMLPPSVQVEVTPKPIDPLLRESCPKFQTEVRRNPNSTVEYNEFLRGRLIRRVAANVAHRLGVATETITPDLLIKIHKGCFYERWVTSVDGPWCWVFRNIDLEILDYAIDLYNYAKRSFTYPINLEKNCFHSKEIITSLKRASEADRSGEDFLLGQFRFGHVFNVISLAANMDLYQVDERPTASNFRSQRDRFYKVSQMIPSAGHLAFVLYRCGDASDNLNNYKLQVFWNERLVDIPACSAADDVNDDDVYRDSATFCGLDRVLSYYSRFVAGSPDECNQEEICEI